MQADNQPNLNEQMNAFVCHLIDCGLRRDEAMNEFRKIYTVQILAKNKGNQCKASRQAGIHRNTMSRDIELYQIDMSKLVEKTRKLPPRSAPRAAEHLVDPIRQSA